VAVRHSRGSGPPPAARDRPWRRLVLLPATAMVGTYVVLRFVAPPIIVGLFGGPTTPASGSMASFGAALGHGAASALATACVFLAPWATLPVAAVTIRAWFEFLWHRTPWADGSRIEPRHRYRVHPR